MVAFATSCSSGSDASPAVERADSSCAERVVVIGDSDDEGIISVDIVDTADADAEAIARQIVETLELARVGGELGDRSTPMGAGELAESGFVLPAGPDCRTDVSFDADVGADSASLRFVELKVDSPGCDIIRFRTVLRDPGWLLDDVTTAPAAALEEACD